jgi:hypothetical protein
VNTSASEGSYLFGIPLTIKFCKIKVAFALTWIKGNKLAKSKVAAPVLLRGPGPESCGVLWGVLWDVIVTLRPLEI